MNAEVAKALVFDVFGTVVDWHGSVAREVRTLAKERDCVSMPRSSPRRGAPATGRRWTA